MWHLMKQYEISQCHIYSLIETERKIINMKNNINNRTMELADLQNMLISICYHLNRPIRKNQLVKMVIDLFECSTPKQIEYALLDLLEQNKLCQQNYFIVTPKFLTSWDGTVTASDEGIIKFLLSLKEDAKFDIYFNVYAKEHLTPSVFFKYVEMQYPALLNRTDTALSYMKQMENLFSYGLGNNFFAEQNDYPAKGWFTTFFNHPDCRILIKQMDQNKNHINIHLILLPGKRRSYRLAHEQYQEFKQHINNYFNRNIQVHIRTTLLTLVTGNQRKH